jgi:Dual-action HEIGH metallo-peptidase
MSITPRLRRARIPAALLCACSLLAACQDSVVAPAAANRVDVTDPLLQRVVAMGFRAEDVADAGDYFVVEGDMLIPKAALRGAPRMNVSATGGPSFHHHTTTLIPQSTMAQGLTVSLSAISGNAAWTTATRNAMAAWNNSPGTKIKFIEITSGTPDIPVSFNTNIPGAAQGGLTINGFPGVVYINTAYNGISAAQKLATMIHEFGHTIGHRHSDMAATGETPGVYGSVHVPGTPSTAVTASIMRSSSITWSGSFTALDNVANQYMYPVHGVTVTSQGVDGSGNFSASWNPVADASSYRIDYEYWFEDFSYDPTYPGGGYYVWLQNYYTYTTTSSTSFTAPPQGTGANPYACAFMVTPVYPNGRTGHAVRLQDLTC